METNTRKICFVITSFIHYARSFLILRALAARPDVEVHVILGGAALLSKYVSRFANIRHELKRDGVTNIHELYFNLEGSIGITKAKTAGLGIVEFASVYDKIKPDLVVIRGDRFEVLAAALAAVHMNIPVAHIEGGDVSGTIDESIRHAITKLAHVHFPTTRPAADRIQQMGESADYIFLHGSPDVEVVRHCIDQDGSLVDLLKTGSGAHFSITEDFIMVLYHPVTTEWDKLAVYTKTVLDAVHATGLAALWFWPNFDAGAEEITHELHVFRDTIKEHKIRFMRYLLPQHFFQLLNQAKCLVGNSSAGIKECSYLGVPVVNVGSRQRDRLRAGHVQDVSYTTEEILQAIRQQVTHGKYPPATLYQGQQASQNIADTLAVVDLYLQKKFYDQPRGNVTQAAADNLATVDVYMKKSSYEQG